MGLSVAVGILADLKRNDEEGFARFKEELANLNRALAAQGLPTYAEPEDLPEDKIVSLDMYGYSGLHYLRRIAVHLWAGNPLPPPGDDDASHDPMIEKHNRSLGKSPSGFLARLLGLGKRPAACFDHLLMHSDCEGYYVPVDFREVMFPDEGLGVAGSMIGSSQMLLRECEALSRALEIPAGLDPEDDALWEATESQGEGERVWQRYGVESFTCLRLLHAARASVELGAAIVFC